MAILVIFPTTEKKIASQLMATMLKQLCSFHCELPDIIAETPDVLKALISHFQNVCYIYTSLIRTTDGTKNEVHEIYLHIYIDVFQDTCNREKKLDFTW